MTSIAALPLSGTYRAQPVSSTFAFGIRHSGVFWFRGSFSDVEATLHSDVAGLTLEGSARVDSISVVEPAALRTHLLARDFFDAEEHPELRFRSTVVRLDDDGGARVDGELTMRGVTRPISAVGHYAGPRQAAFGEVTGIELHTCLDRREFGFDWQAEMPGGGEAAGWEVEVDIDLLLIRDGSR